jgi:hypothetical protein
VFKHCWRLQTDGIKCICQRNDAALAQGHCARGTVEEQASAARIAMSPSTVIYIEASSDRYTELELSKKEIMLITQPLDDSMEWTGIKNMDNYEFSEDDPVLCATKYTEEQAALQKLCDFQSANGIDPSAFKPDIAIPIVTSEMNTFVWTQSDAKGGINMTGRNKTPNYKEWSDTS